MSTVKILFFPGLFTSGGVEAVVMNIFRNIDKEKFCIDFCVPRDYAGQHDEEVKSFGSKVIAIPRIKQVGIIKYIKIVKGIIEKNGPYHVVHVHSIHNGVYSIIASYFAGIRKRIYHVHNTDDPSLKNIKFPNLYRLLTRKLIKIFCTNYLACGEEAANYVYGRKNNKVEIINNALDLDIFEPKTPDYSEEIKKYYKADIIIGNAARFTDVKNQFFLIDLLYEFNKVNKKSILLLAGEGPTRQRCEEYAKELGVRDNVDFLGNLKNMPDFYNKLDVFVLPSLHEGLPVSVLEAQACGIPCIISKNITTECDLGLNIVDSISLDESLEVWVSKTERIASLKEYNHIKISNEITEHGYSIDCIITKLSMLYTN